MGLWSHSEGPRAPSFPRQGTRFLPSQAGWFLVYGGVEGRGERGTYMHGGLESVPHSFLYLFVCVPTGFSLSLSPSLGISYRERSHAASSPWDWFGC